jgi:hypothetical protein
MVVGALVTQPDGDGMKGGQLLDGGGAVHRRQTRWGPLRRLQ